MEESLMLLKEKFHLKDEIRRKNPNKGIGLEASTLGVCSPISVTRLTRS